MPLYKMCAILSSKSGIMLILMPIFCSYKIQMLIFCLYMEHYMFEILYLDKMSSNHLSLYVYSVILVQMVTCSRNDRLIQGAAHFALRKKTVALLLYFLHY
uniref:Uncharacterized protein n=1 Tax=Solanum lycopersicum TaxID=4081 RepID=A0A3Q7HMX3_SOLLC